MGDRTDEASRPGTLNSINECILRCTMVVEIKRIQILTRAEVSPEEFDRIYQQLKGSQLPIKARRGKATYKVGEIRAVAAGRNALLVDIALRTNFTLITSDEGDEIVAEHLEWKL